MSNSDVEQDLSPDSEDGRPRAGELVLAGVSKSYDLKQPQRRAVADVSLQFSAGSLVSLLGPSGCGKTTTLRMIAGFEDPTEGDILLDGASIVTMPPEKRPMSMVFQSYALFPHLSVFDNVAFGLKLRRVERSERIRRITDALRMIGIDEYADRYPHELSGGQQQRVALARALVVEPKIILFDEPLSNLDARLRTRMRDEIRSLQQRLGLTAVFVTHDQSEALSISDSLVIMNAGRVEQQGSPVELYQRPANQFVAQFLGSSNFLDGTISCVLAEGRYQVESRAGSFVVSGVAGQEVDSAVSLLLRAENAVLTSGSAGGISAVVDRAVFDGDVVNYTLRTATGPLDARSPGSGRIYQVGDGVSVAVDYATLWALPRVERG